MTAQSKPSSPFYDEFSRMEAQFNNMKPELAITLKDEKMGVEGYIVVWNTGISVGGPLERSGKGGTRITPAVTLDEVKMLARTMALKNAGAGLPLGGAKSGLKANPDDPDFEKKYRRFVELAKPYLLENGGIFGGFGFDIGARPIHPVWACEQLKSLRCFTGKPVSMGGTDYDKEGIAGLGVATAAKTLLEVQKIDPHKVTYTVQGMGAMGGAIVRYFEDSGARLRAIADPKFGGTYIFDTAPSQELVQALALQDQAKAQNLLAKEGHKKAGNDDILYLETDIFFPAAVQNVITRDNAGRVKAKFVVEGANNPCTEEARKSLFERGVIVIPDFIANPGGIIAAFVEMTSNVTPEENARTYANVKKSKELTVSRISDNIRTLLKIAKDFGIDTVEAGKYMAYKNILKNPVAAKKA